MIKIICVLFLYTIFEGSSAFVIPQTTKNITEAVTVDDVAFAKLGTYRGFTDDGAEYQKSYFFSRYSKSFWAEAKAICKAFDLEMPIFETREEALAVMTMAENNSILKKFTSIWLFVDAVTLTPLSTTDWYWTKTGKKISFKMDWLSGNPSGPDQFCLCISKPTITANFRFNDINCDSNPRNIICQRTEFYVPSKEN